MCAVDGMISAPLQRRNSTLLVSVYSVNAISRRAVVPSTGNYD